MERWESTDKPATLILKSSAQVLTEQIFQVLSTTFGKNLVNAVLDFLKFAVAVDNLFVMTLL